MQCNRSNDPHYNNDTDNANGTDNDNDNDNDNKNSLLTYSKQIAV